MDLAEALQNERRARLAAEQLLAQTEAELGQANRQLSQHALRLAGEIIEVRAKVDGIRSDLAAAEGKAEAAERRLWAAIGNMHDGFAFFNAAGRLVAANAAWLRPFDGLEAVRPGASYEQILDLALAEGVIDPGRAGPAAFRQQMLDRWQGDRAEPVMLKLWSGATLRIIDSREAGGGRVSVAVDMTRLARRMVRLQEARSRRDIANRAKSRFLADLSQELRLPLNGIVALAAHLSGSPLQPDQREVLDTIRLSGQALLALINDVLDLTRAEAAHVLLDEAPFDLELVVQEVARLIRPIAREKRIDLRTGCDIFLPARFVGDAGRLRQVLLSLVGDAMKFAGGGTVSVRVTGHEVDGRWKLRFAIEHTGIGVGAGRQSHIFGDFSRIEDFATRQHDGTGLGLAISERLVRQMGGEIWVESHPDEGSSFGFTVLLPAADAERPPAAALRNVLLIDPVPEHAARTMAHLQELGLLVRHVPDGLSALAGLGDDPGLVLTVPHLPDLPLEALVHSLSEGPAPVPVLVLGRAAEAAGSLAVQGLTRRDLRAALSGLATALTAAKPPAPLRRMRVLAAEDNATSRLVLRKMLKDLGVDLRFAEDGAQAVAMWREWQPDLIFMDISMPGLDGKEAARQIRTAEGGERRVPIIALAAHTLERDDAEMLAAGLDRCLTKPLKKTAIVSQIVAAQPRECEPLVLPQPGAAAGTLSLSAAE